MAAPLGGLGCDGAKESALRHTAWGLAPDGGSPGHIDRYTCHASHRGRGLLGRGPFPISSRTAPLAGYSGGLLAGA